MGAPVRSADPTTYPSPHLRMQIGSEGQQWQESGERVTRSAPWQAA